jgi:hypothetical protein
MSGEYTEIRPQQLPSKFFPIRHLNDNILSEENYFGARTTVVSSPVHLCLKIT